MANPNRLDQNNGAAGDEWDTLTDAPRGTFVKGPDGKLIPKDQLDAAMEAYERAQYYKNNPEAAQHDADQEALDARLKEMEENPDRFDRFEGEHKRGASTRNAEYMTLNTGENGMYAAAPDGTPLNNARRREMARMMHDAEDLQTFEENDKYAAYIAREREKIGTVYRNRDDFNHRVVARLRRLDQKDADLAPAEPNSSDEKQPLGQNQPDDNIPRLTDDDVDVLPPDPNRFFRPTNPQITGPTSINRPLQITGPSSIDRPPQITGPSLGETRLIPGPVEGEKNRVEIGEINIEGIKQEFAEDKSERLAKDKERLEKLLPKLAELYAKNRRLIVGIKNRAEFAKIKGEYGELLDEYLRLKAEGAFEKGKHELTDKIQSRVEELRAEVESKLTEFMGGDPQNTEKTQEEVDAEKSRLIKEAKEKLDSEYGEWVKALETKVNCNFVDDFINQEAALEKATVDKLDNGSICRRFVSKVINNKALKGVLVGAAAIGLAVTGVGLATGLAAGTMSIGLGFTAGGVATGALKGGLGGLLMSRQDSKNSAVRQFTNQDEIRRQLEGIDVSKQDVDTANVTDWLMKQYGNANREDRQTNVKKTAISAGLGALIGGLASGIHIDNVVKTEKTFRRQIGNTALKTEYDVTDNLSQVNQPRGTGLYKTMEQMGVPREKWGQALKIAYDIEPNYGLSPGSNGVIAGFDGTVGRFAEAYPGPIDSWPDVAQEFITETAKEWAKQGLMPSRTITTGGMPIYDNVTKAAIDYIPNAFMNFLTRATAIAGASALGGSIGDVGTSRAINRPVRSGDARETSSVNAVNQPVEPRPSGETSATGAVNQAGENAPVPDILEGVEFESTEKAERALRLLEELRASMSAENSGTTLDNESEQINAALEQQADAIANGAELEDVYHTEEAEQNPGTDLAVPEDLRNALGSEGMSLLMSDGDYVISSDDEKYSAFWNSLPQNRRQEIEDLLNANPNSQNGKTIRQWLVLHNGMNQ